MNLLYFEFQVAYLVQRVKCISEKNKRQGLSSQKIYSSNMEDFEISYLKDEFHRVKGFGVEHHWKIFLDLFVIFIFIKIKIEILFLLESGFHRKFNQDSKA